MRQEGMSVSAGLYREAVAVAPEGVDGYGGVCLEAFAEAGYVDVEAAGGKVIVMSPELFENKRVRYDGARPAAENIQDLRLHSGKLCAGYAMPGPVGN